MYIPIMDAHLQLDNQLCFALHAASRAMTQAYQPVLDPLGLTYPQYLAMLVLWEEDDVPVKRLGERLHLDSGTLTPLLKRLASQGLVDRTRDRDDERVVRIQLTAAGRALKRRAQGVPKQMFYRASLTLTEVLRLRSELDHLAQNLRAASATTPEEMQR